MHGPWRLNATKYILDIKFSTQMYTCTSRRCRLNGASLYAHRFAEEAKEEEMEAIAY